MKKRKTWSSLAFIFLFTLLSAACLSQLLPGSHVNAAKPKISRTKATLMMGQTLALSVKNNSKKVNWSSSAPSVASVSKSGKVTAKAEGSAVIRAKVKSRTYRCRITVKGDYRAIYRAFLENSTQEFTWSESSYTARYTLSGTDFCLLDINRDGLPELILNPTSGRCATTYSSGDTYYSTLSHTLSYYVFTIRNGKLVFAGSVSESENVTNKGQNYKFSFAYNKSQKAIRMSSTGPYSAHFELLTLSNGKLKIVKSSTAIYNRYNNFSISKNGKAEKNTTSKKLDAFVAKYMENVKFYSLYDNIAVNRAKYIK